MNSPGSSIRKSREEVEATLDFQREQLLEALWNWLVARPQRTDGDEMLRALEAFLDARDEAKGRNDAASK